MDELQTTNRQLPDTLDDLSKFVLVNEEKIQALRAQIRAIKKVSVAREVYEQKLAEAQEIGQITVEAAQKMGELLLQIQKATPNNNPYHENRDTSNFVKSKAEITSEMGMTADQVSQYQQMFKNPEAVQAAIQKAIERGDVVSRSQVMKEIRAVKEEAERKIRELENRPPEVKEVVKAPADYEEIKRKAEMAEIHERDFQKMRQSYEEMAEKWKEENIEKEKLKESIKKKEEAPETMLHESALVFCAGISNFIERFGGYVWLSSKLNDLDEFDRKGFISGIKALEAWVQQMKVNMEVDLYE